MHKVLEDLQNKKILILGFAREGQSTLKFLQKYFPGKKIDITDQKDGVDYLKNIESYDVVFKSPGIPNKLPEIKSAKQKEVIFSSQAQLFFELCTGTIIGVTGTKGKSTTTSLIHHILLSSGKNSVLLGNIGRPCLDYLSDDLGRDTYFCFELSSHQLVDVKSSPHISVLLNIYKEHLDYYESFEDYLNAKFNIARFQGSSDYLIYNKNFAEFSHLNKITKANLIAFSATDKLVALPQNLSLRGEHNLNNINASILVARQLGIGDQKIIEALLTFKPLDHRLQIVGTYKNVTFVEDSLATIPEATIAAIDAFHGQIGSIILGGTNRGQDFTPLAKKIIEEKIDTVVLFPTTGQLIWEKLQEIGGDKLPQKYDASDMESAVKYCYLNTPKGKICLLSTASPSFTLFKDYEEKAALFRKYVEQYS